MNQRVEEASAVSGVRMMEKTDLPVVLLGHCHGIKVEDRRRSTQEGIGLNMRECVCHNVVNSMNLLNHRGEL